MYTKNPAAFHGNKGDNMELSLREYARQLNISYEAVRQSFKTHEGTDLIEGIHFRKNGRARILTDAGISVMNEYRKKPIAFLPEDVTAMQAEITSLREQIRTLEEEKTRLEAENADLRQQIFDVNEKLNQRNDSLIDALLRLQNAQERLLTVHDEPQPQKRGLFARIFRRE